MTDEILSAVTGLGEWGYLIIFLGATLESAAFLGLLVPGETLVLFGGFLASRGVLDLTRLMILISIGAILGDSIGYELGRHFGRAWLLRYGHWVWLRPEHLDRAEQFFVGHGGKTVFFGRFVGFLRALAPFVAGAAGMPYGRFLLFNAAGGILWSITFVTLGYAVGESWRVLEQWIGRAGAVVGVIIALALVLAGVWRWLITREAEVKLRWNALRGHPRVQRIRSRFAPVLGFLAARLTPGEYLGLHLTAGALVLTAAVWVFGVIAKDVVRGEILIVVDREAVVWLHAHETPALTRSMLWLTYLGSAPLILGLVALFTVAFAMRRSWYRILTLLLAVPGGMFVNHLLKLLFERQRPDFAEALVVLTSYAFPSGHTIAAVLLYGTLSAFALRSLESFRWRVLAVLAAGFLVLLVGFSRMYLGVHYLSDVLGAIAIGTAWLTLCLTAVESLRLKRLAQPRVASADDTPAIPRLDRGTNPDPGGDRRE